MIKDKKAKNDILKSWVTVRKKQKMVSANSVTGRIGGGVLTIDFIEFSYNLLLIFAYSVLDDVLNQLLIENKFPSKGRTLGKIMHDSKSHLSWIDFKLVDEGRDKRNDIAHDNAIIPQTDCLKYIDAIEEELISWNVIQSKIKVNYTITRKRQ